MIVDTVRNRIKSQLEEGIQAGETIMELSDRIRNEYNMATSRSLLIARTETIGALNGGSLLYYENEGIKFKEWLTAGDELVRDSHRACERQGAILMNERFINGLRYPGDQDGGAGEVCNCRCSLLPVIK
jgi:SPP1 gp7 family putative phage head morphogenesis protein